MCELHSRALKVHLRFSTKKTFHRTILLTGVFIGETHLYNVGLLYGMHAQLRIWVSSDASAAVVAFSAAILEGQLDGVRGLGRLDDQLAREDEEVRPVDLVAVGLVDGLVYGEDGRSRFDQAGATECVSDAAIGAHQVRLGQVEVHCIVEHHPHRLAIHGRQLLLGSVRVLGLQGVYLSQKLCFNPSVCRAESLSRVDHRSPCRLGAYRVGEGVVNRVAHRNGWSVSGPRCWYSGRESGCRG